MARCIVILKEDVFSGMLQTRKRDQIFVKHILVTWGCSQALRVQFQSTWTVFRHKCHLHQLKKYPAGNTNSPFQGVCAVLVSCHRHLPTRISVYQSKQHFPTFLGFNVDVHAPMLSIALCDVQSAEVPSRYDNFCNTWRGNNFRWCGHLHIVVH